MANDYLSGPSVDPNNSYGSNWLNPDIFAGLNQVTDNISQATRHINSQIARRVQSLEGKLLDIVGTERIPNVSDIMREEGSKPKIPDVGAIDCRNYVSIGGKTVGACCLVKLTFVGMAKSEYEELGFKVMACTPLSGECGYETDWILAGIAVKIIEGIGTPINSIGESVAIGVIFDDKTCNPKTTSGDGGDTDGDDTPTNGSQFPTNGGGDNSCPPQVINVQPCSPTINVQPCAPEIRIENTGPITKLEVKPCVPEIHIHNEISSKTTTTTTDCVSSCNALTTPKEREECRKACESGKFKNHLEWMTVEPGMTQLHEFVKLLGMPLDDLRGGNPFAVVDNLFRIAYSRCYVKQLVQP